MNRGGAAAIDSQPVTEYLGVVTGEVVLGANVFRSLFANLRDKVWEATPLITRDP